MKIVLATTIATLLVAMATATVQADSSAQLPASRAEVDTLLRSAHSPEQYHVLALYFHKQQAALERQAQDEQAEWQRRSQNIVGIAAKYPRPVDSSRNRYQYFVYEAGRAAQQAVHYDALAAE